MSYHPNPGQVIIRYVQYDKASIYALQSKRDLYGRTTHYEAFYILEYWRVKSSQKKYGAKDIVDFPTWNLYVTR